MKKVKLLYLIPVMSILSTTIINATIEISTNNNESTISSIHNAIKQEKQSNAIIMLNMRNPKDQETVNVIIERLDASSIGQETIRNAKLAISAIPILEGQNESINLQSLDAVTARKLFRADDENISNTLQNIFTNETKKHTYSQNARDFKPRIHWQNTHAHIAHRIYKNDTIALNHVKLIISFVEQNEQLLAISQLRELMHTVQQKSPHSISSQMLEGVSNVPINIQYLSCDNQALYNFHLASIDTNKHLLYLKYNQDPNLQNASTETSKILFLIESILHSADISSQAIGPTWFWTTTFITITTIGFLSILLLITLPWLTIQTHEHHHNIFTEHKSMYDERTFANSNTESSALTQADLATYSITIPDLRDLLAAAICHLSLGVSKKASAFCGFPGKKANNRSNVLKIDTRTRTILDTETRTIHDSVSKSIHDSASRTIHESASKSIHDSASKTIYDTASKSMHDSASKTVHESASKTIYDTASKSMHDSASKTLYDTASKSMHDSASRTLYDTASNSMHDSASRSKTNTPIIGACGFDAMHRYDVYATCYTECLSSVGGYVCHTAGCESSRVIGCTSSCLSCLEVCPNINYYLLDWCVSHETNKSNSNIQNCGCYSSDCDPLRDRKCELGL